MFRALFIVMISFGDLMGAIVDETQVTDHIQAIKDGIKEGWKLTISPTPESEPKILLKRPDDTLNLTCKIQKLDKSDLGIGNSSLVEQQFKLAWYVPNSLEKSKQRVVNYENRNSLQLIVTKLQDSDSGEYKCTAHDSTDNTDTHAFSGSLNVIVRPKKGALLMLGKGCDKLGEINCTSRLMSPCCNPLQSIHLNLDVSQFSPNSNHYNEIGYLQTTIYTVIGCAMVFMFLTTVVVIAICRVHLKRAAVARRQNPFHHLRHFGLHRRDSGSWSSFSQSNPASGLLVAYNINNGLHFMGRPMNMNPPPYSEIMNDPPVEGVPSHLPPPYSSTDNLTEVENHINSCNTPNSIPEENSPA